jgi:hypothetical protein
MPIASPRVRQNYLAIVIAAVACFLFEAAWYSLFLEAWLKGIGHDHAWLVGQGANPALQYGTALLSEALIATAISCVTQLTGTLTALRAMKVAAILWLGLVLPTIAVEEVFEVRSYALFAVNTGFWLLGMVLMGAIVGAWKKARK